MNTFELYLPLGFDHIVSLAGFDHLLFVLVLCAVYGWQQWRRVLGLLTGFTLGHSLTLAITALNGPLLPSKWVELLIPVTILLTGVANVAGRQSPPLWRAFGMATLFGLIHGCGFAGYFGMLLGDSESVVGPLFAFNVGLELGQITIVLAYYTALFLLEKIRPVDARACTLFVSGAGVGLAVKMILEQVFS